MVSAETGANTKLLINDDCAFEIQNENDETVWSSGESFKGDFEDLNSILHKYERLNVY